jgi:hypothetical protein
MRGSQPCWDDAGSKRVIPPKGAIKQECDRAERELAGLNAALAPFVCAYSGKKPKTKTAALPPVNAGSCLPHPDLRWQPRNGHHGKSSVRGSGTGRSVKLLLNGLHWKTHCRAFRMSFISANLQDGFFFENQELSTTFVHRQVRE